MILVVCGPPGAGKTTITNRVRDRLARQGVRVESHHSDEFSSRTYERLYERVSEGPENAVHLVDGTFYRREWQTQFRTLEDVRFVHVTASLGTCLERNRSRPDSIDEQGVHVVYREFDDPDADVVIDTDDCTVTEAVDRVVAALAAWGWLDAAAE
ncbi:AAA family ATPase [Halosolutus amylolyticus]|uniref:AAA family ATPase n=1 Tax=Halosolutus amylolyticus TaxID=2932267 RepID=A0ABD5PTR8_9EURY|nr:AAA family ATPase [Halosolutus amylolyticus]